ncbi:hypothetical protein [Methylosinus sp. PW1]|uniref:hypothetical protein n=1 Tax=Methylosinus sp. PW1 TaxID=107636 RepID=UPI0012EC8332|nr:hypothetical protein [Methylosinus sp. PW1]
MSYKQLEDGTWITEAVQAAWDGLSPSEKWRSVWFTFIHEKDPDRGIELIKQLLRDDEESTPLEGKRLLAELLDSKHDLLDRILIIRERETGSLRQGALKKAHAVLSEIERTGCSKTAAARKLFGDGYRAALRSVESFDGAFRRRKPWAPWNDP